MTKETTYEVYCRDRVTHETVWQDLVENSNLDWDGETRVEIPFDTIIENMLHDSDVETQYVEIYDANDEYGNLLYTNEGVKEMTNLGFIGNETVDQHWNRVVHELAVELKNAGFDEFKMRLSYLTSERSGYAMGCDTDKLMTDVAWDMRCL